MVRELMQPSLPLFGMSWMCELVALLAVLLGRNGYTNIMLYIGVADFSLGNENYWLKKDF